MWLFVARKKKTITKPENIEGMVSMVPRTRVVRFPKAFHWIHNSNVGEFMKRIENVYVDLENTNNANRA